MRSSLVWLYPKPADEFDFFLELEYGVLRLCSKWWNHFLSIECFYKRLGHFSFLHWQTGSEAENPGQLPHSSSPSQIRHKLVKWNLEIHESVSNDGIPSCLFRVFTRTLGFFSLFPVMEFLRLCLPSLQKPWILLCPVQIIGIPSCQFRTSPRTLDILILSEIMDLITRIGI